MPTQTEIDFRQTAGGNTQNARLRRYFLDRPGRWLGLTELAGAIHAFAIGSRVSDLRKKFGMNIVNRTELDRNTGQRLSWYKLVLDQGGRPEAIEPHAESSGGTPGEEQGHAGY